MAHFWGQNDVISQNLGKVVKKIFLQKFGKIFPGGSPDRKLTKNVIKGVIFVKICIFWCCPYISQLKCLYIGYFAQTSLSTPLPTTFMGQNTIFPTPQTSLQVTKLVATSTPLDFFVFRTASLEDTRMRR